jgi:hypothetical protein
MCCVLISHRTLFCVKWCWCFCRFATYWMYFTITAVLSSKGGRCNYCFCCIPCVVLVCYLPFPLLSVCGTTGHSVFCLSFAWSRTKISHWASASFSAVFLEYACSHMHPCEMQEFLVLFCLFSFSRCRRKY